MVKKFVYQSLLQGAELCVLSCCAEIGDYVEQDEEIATIETDKVRDFL